MAGLADMIQLWLAQQHDKLHPPGPQQPPPPAAPPPPGPQQTQTQTQTPPPQAGQPSFMGWGGAPQGGQALPGGAPGGVGGAGGGAGAGPSTKYIKEAPWWDQGLTYVGGRSPSAPGGPNINIALSQFQQQQQQQQQQQVVNVEQPPPPAQTPQPQPEVPRPDPQVPPTTFPFPGLPFDKGIIPGNGQPGMGQGQPKPQPQTPQPGGGGQQPDPPRKVPPGVIPKIPTHGGPNTLWPTLNPNSWPIQTWDPSLPNPNNAQPGVRVPNQRPTPGTSTATPGGTSTPGGGMGVVPSLPTGVTPTNPSGAPFDPSNTDPPPNLPKDPQTGNFYNPTTGYPVGLDPATGQYVDLVTGQRFNADGTQVDQGQAAGWPAAPDPGPSANTGQTVHGHFSLGSLFSPITAKRGPDPDRVQSTDNVAGASGGGLQRDDHFAAGDNIPGGGIPRGPDGELLSPVTGNPVTADGEGIHDTVTGQTLVWDATASDWQDKDTGQPATQPNGPQFQASPGDVAPRVSFDGQPHGPVKRRQDPNAPPPAPRPVIHDPAAGRYDQAWIDPYTRRRVRYDEKGNAIDTDTGRFLVYDPNTGRLVYEEDGTAPPLPNLFKDGTGRIVRTDPATGATTDDKTGRPVKYDPVRGIFVDAETGEVVGSGPNVAGTSSALTAQGKWPTPAWSQKGPPGSRAGLVPLTPLAPFNRAPASRANMLPNQGSPPSAASQVSAANSPQRSMFPDWSNPSGGGGGSNTPQPGQLGARPALTAGTFGAGGGGGGMGGNATPAQRQPLQSSIFNLYPSTQTASSTSSGAPAQSMPAAFTSLPSSSTSTSTAATTPTSTTTQTRAPTGVTPVTSRPSTPSTYRPPTYTPNYAALGSYLSGYRAPTYTPSFGFPSSTYRPPTSIGSAWSYSAPSYSAPSYSNVTRAPSYSAPVSSYSPPRTVSSGTFNAISAPRTVSSGAIFKSSAPVSSFGKLLI